MSITVPIPATFEQAVWLAMGLTFGRAFGKKLDWDIVNSDWFKAQSAVTQNILSRVLDFTHHWWAGALLMLYAPPQLWVFTYTMMYWFAGGLLLDDLPDVPSRLSKIFNGYLTSPVEVSPAVEKISVVGEFTSTASPTEPT